MAYNDANGNGVFDDTTEFTYASSLYAAPGTERNLLYLKGTGWASSYYAYAFGNLGWVLYEESGIGQTISPIPWTDGLIAFSNN